FLGLSLVPVCFLFAFAYGLLNRSIDKWFGAPFDAMRKDANEVVGRLDAEEQQNALHATEHLATSSRLLQALARKDAEAIGPLLARQTRLGMESEFCFDLQGRLLAHAGAAQPDAAAVVKLIPGIATGDLPSDGVAAHWGNGAAGEIVAARPVEDPPGRRVATVAAVRRLPADVAGVAAEMQNEIRKYDELSRAKKIVRVNYLLALGLLTLLILFAATWFALFLSKQVTVPIQALAEGTHQVSKGNLGFQVVAPSSGELKALIRSFNDMTRQLQENRQAIERAAKELQRANRELEERGNTMETILENIPTGVISFDPEGQIVRINSTVERMFAPADLKAARRLTDLFSAEDARDIARLFRRAARQGTITQQMELDLGARHAAVALTVSSIRARHGAVGSVLVLEDLSELLRAQKAAAWREVAQRLAHEIKNPLTPIQLSAERIRRLIERAGSHWASGELAATIEESAELIGREVETLKSLVDEFSRFARFPSSRVAPTSVNAVIENALRVFDGRLSGIEVHQELAADLPLVQLDPEQMKRVMVNLIDNAAEALERSVPKEIWVRTALDPDRDVVELVVADSGPGIPPDAKEKLFLPSFSTKDRGTGLGLAIVSHIISEHHGSIRVEENRPTGSQFVIELPVERAAVLSRDAGL
ncbi:MAG TPA: ATP-binding protein, partial [Terriglobia bacterium]|nr:ATP-binding protein [Terriglobia bacterium]